MEVGFSMVVVARDKALKEVNGFREQLGVDSLEDWPVGLQNDPQECPVGLALTLDNPKLLEVYVEETTLTLVPAPGHYEEVLKAVSAFSGVEGLGYARCPFLSMLRRAASWPSITVSLKSCSRLAQMIRNLDLGCYPDLIAGVVPWEEPVTLTLDRREVGAFKPPVLVAVF